MKKIILMMLASVGLAVNGAMPQPVLNYDFSRSVIAKDGKAGEPVFTGTPKIGDDGVILDGKKVFMTVPDSANISMVNGGTLFAVVEFNDDGTTGGTPEAHDMIFFKTGEFLFGRTEKKLYFNVGMGKNWLMTSTAPGLESKKKVAVAAVLKKNDTNYEVSMFIDGKRVFNKKFYGVKYEVSTHPVTIGKGWGGPWFFNGKIFKVELFDIPLDDAQVAELK